MTVIRATVCGWLVILALACYPATAQASQTAQNWDLQRVNTVRTNHHLNELQRGLQAHAQAYAEQMARTGKLRDDGGADRPCANAGGTFVGSNVGYGVSVRTIERAFERSPRHRANILYPRFWLLGVGVAHGHGGTWVVQDFCGDK